MSAGEPAGIGPDLCVQLGAQGALDDVVVVADADLLAGRAQLLGLAALEIECIDSLHDVAMDRRNALAIERTVASDTLAFERLDRRDVPRESLRPRLRVWHHPLGVPVTPGVLDPRNAHYVLACLDSAIDACRDGHAAALVTGPVQKSTIADAGIAFMGHTEYLAQRLGVDQVVMMLVGGGLRVALATTHLPLRNVADALTPELLDRVLQILDADLRTRFGLPNPRILVAGLNPHAGESGHLGDEELRVIGPALARGRARGEQLFGPLPADTLFTPAWLERGDAVLAMYHDQGLPVLKMRSFGGGVNVTLGLPIIRTSVDHGTALDLAGQPGRADDGSLREAIQLARTLVAGSGASH